MFSNEILFTIVEGWLDLSGGSWITKPFWGLKNVYSLEMYKHPLNKKILVSKWKALQDMPREVKKASAKFSE